MSEIELVSSKARSNLFEEYIFVSVQQRGADIAVETYSRNGLFYLMTVGMKDGMKHGDATMVDEYGRFIASLTYVHGKLTGPCKLCNAEGIIMFEGFLVDGEKRGFCHEYDEQGNEIFEGVYREGRKIPYFEEIADKPGFYLERSKKDLHEVSYTQYDPARKEKNGVCYLLNSFGCVVKEIVVRGEEEVEVRRLFEGNTMLEYTSNGKIVYVGCFHGDWKSGFNRHGYGVEYDGNSSDAVSSRKMYEGEFINGERALIYTKIKSGDFSGFYEGKTIDGRLSNISQMQSGTLVKHGRCIEFSTETELPVRETVCENGEVIYERVHVTDNQMTECDERGTVVYKGEFRYIRGVFIRWGKGMEFERENVIQYNGEFMNGYYHGRGTFYRSGYAYFKGDWKYGYPEGDGSLYQEDGKVKLKGNWHMGYLGDVDYLTCEQKKSSFGCFMGSREREVNKRMKDSNVIDEERKKYEEEEQAKRETTSYWNARLTVCHGLDLTFARGLKEFEIGDNSMNGTYNDDVFLMKLNLSQFPRLKKVKIGCYCFKLVRELILDGLEQLETVKIGKHSFRTSLEKREDGLCRITNCPNLRKVVMGDGSFKDFRKFEIANVNSLQSITIRAWCFWFADNCILKGKCEK